MKILFVSSLYPKEYQEQLRREANGLLQNSVNVFQWAVVDGLVANKANFDIVTLPALPAYPVRYKCMFTPYGEFSVGDEHKGIMLKYCAFMAYKSISIQHSLQQYLMQWCENNILNNDKLVILTYTPEVAYVKAVCRVKKKYPCIELACIVTDLVDDMMNFASNRGLLKRLQCKIKVRETKKSYRFIDKFILLTKAMEDKIPEALGKNIVVEGIAPAINDICVNKKDNMHTIIYTGTFDEFGGVKNLVDAFILTKNPQFRLQLCGDGCLTKYIQEKAREDKRIEYYGLVTRERAVELQKNATVVVNPRKPNGGITKYSFPSKTMEYLSSGTPMIGYRLEGIPEEYYEHFYTPENLSIEALCIMIDETLTTSQEVLNKKAIEAKEFIRIYKTAKIQVLKIITFLNDNM